MASLNLEYVTPWEAPSGQYFSYHAAPTPEALPIGGYAYALRFLASSARDSLKVTDGTFLRLASDSMSLRVARNGDLLFDIPLQPVVDSGAAYALRKPNQQVPSAALCVETHRGTGAALVCFRQLTGLRRQGAARITWLEGDLFLRLP
jgi:hypothetical protein